MGKKIDVPKKQISFHVMREKFELESIMPDPPEGEVIKIISNGGFSSIAFIRYMSDLCGIDNLYASSLAIGKRHIEAMDVMNRNGKLDNAFFVVGRLMKELNTKYDYYGQLKKICKKNKWNLEISKNHSKIILIDTKLGKFVLETSSNLNENPSIEHFSFEKNEELYMFYKDNFFGMFEGREQDE